MSRTRSHRPILLTSITLVLLVQVAVAGPVCTCSVNAAAMPCHAPVAPEPGRCCQDPSPTAGCSTGITSACCKVSVVSDEARDAALLPETGSLRVEPDLADADSADFLPVAPVSPVALPAPDTALIPEVPAFLRHASLLL